MSKQIEKYSLHEIESRIFTIRYLQVMIDRDIAEMYGVETKVLNQAVKRNVERFPVKCRFQLSQIERNRLVTNCDRLESLKHSSSMPYVFTEQGVAMLSAVLKSPTAIQISLHIMDAFVKMRSFIADNTGLFQRLDNMEQRHLQFQVETDQRFEQVFKALETKSDLPNQGIFFNGQMYDAYIFTASLIRKAQQSIILIDNYVDETVLTLLSKRGKNVAATIYTKTNSKQMQLDLKNTIVNILKSK